MSNKFFLKGFNSVINDSPDKIVLNSIEWTQGWSHTFQELDHEIIYMVILLTSASSRKGFFSYKRKYVHEVLVSRCVQVSHVKGGVR